MNDFALLDEHLPAYAAETPPEDTALISVPDFMPQEQAEAYAAAAAPAAPAAASPRSTTFSTKDGIALALPAEINTQEEWDALASWQKELIQLQRQGMQFTPEAAARFAMDRIDEERKLAAERAKSERAGGATLRPSDVMKISEMRTLSDLADKAAALVEELPDGALGPIDTRWNDARSKLIGSDPKYQSAMQAYNAVKNQILKMRSGAAVTENEMQRMLREVGDPKEADATFKRTIRAFANQTRTGLKDQVHALKSAGYALPEDFATIASEQRDTPAAASSATTGERVTLRGVTYERTEGGKWRRVQ